MNAQTHYSKSSVLILSAVVTAVIAIVVLGGGKWFKKVIFWESHLDESVYGLAIGGPTKYGGMQVGRVEAIDVVGDEYGSGPSKDDLGKRGRSEVDAPTITIVVKPGEGHSVSLGGMGVVFKVPGTATGGAFAVGNTPSSQDGSCRPTCTCARTSILMCWKGRSVRGSVTRRLWWGPGVT